MAVCGFAWFAFINRRLSLPLNLGFVLLQLCFAFYLLGIIHTSHIYETNTRDLRNGLCVLLTSILLFCERTPLDFLLFRDKAQMTGALAGTLLAVIGLYKFHLMASGQMLQLLWVDGYKYPWGTSLTVDYNFYAFAILCGAISCLFCFSKVSSIIAKVMYGAGFVLNIMSLSLSGSRRGWVTETVLLMAVLFILFRWIFLSLLCSRGGVFLSQQRLKALTAIVLLAAAGPILMEKYLAWFAENNHTDFESEKKDLQFRFSTLSDPSESFGPRISRWEFAAQLLDHASPVELVFGQGFGYLDLFANSLNITRKHTEAATWPEDYPHNPVISAALYSGVIGGVIVLSFILLALFRYVKQRHIDVYFGILYFASLWFILPAYNSLFSGKFFGILMLIPWGMPPGGGAIVSVDRLRLRGPGGSVWS
ncbi:MAG: O-antigen ligase family protein [Acidobacteriaceae bacterium]|nr:O-antigen ligase family protein [Acidobacteriaceae bacterium]